MDVRAVNAGGAIVCAGLMVYALYTQHGLGLEPCPLCIFQRVAVIALGCIFLVAAVHRVRSTGRKVYAILLAVIAFAGIGIAGRHVWLTTLPPDRVPACGPGLDFMLESFPFVDAVRMVLSGSGECAQVDWQLLGINMPGWVLIALLALGTAGFAVNWRAATAR